MPISKNKIKYIRSLEQKKTRREEGVFVAEGPKLTGDLLGRFHCRYLAATAEWMNAHPLVQADEKDIANLEDLQRASLLKTPQDVIAVFEQRNEATNTSVIERELCLALDDVQDPGNFGTIIRIADWFGIEHIFCSLGTADVYNPKVVQATMGALARVHVHYLSLTELIEGLKEVPVYGTFLDGTNIYKQSLSETGLIVMGNEGNGISAEVRKLINRKLYIPNFPAGRSTSESLNVAVATAITCAEFRRRY
ncbi:MAG: RNA methyltransferase [Bacteroidaceae bacterium]|nr:RNA methyltransferase [Bacteroidaceae bacterium]